MRLALLAIGTLLFSFALIAADPFEGTWRLNVEKSKGMDQVTAQSRIVMAMNIRAAGPNTYRQIIQWGNPSRKAEETVETVIWDGKDYENNEGSKPEGYTSSIQRIDGFHALRVFKKDGNEYQRSEMSISSDGRTLTVHQWGIGRRTSRRFDITQIYDKQQ